MQTLVQSDVSILVKSLLAWKLAQKCLLSLLGDNIPNSFITNLKFIIIPSCMQIIGLKLADNTFAENNAQLLYKPARQQDLIS